MTIISSLKNSQIKETQPARNEEISTGMNWRLKKCRVNFSLQIFIHWSGAVACFFNNTLLYCQKLLKRILNIFPCGLQLRGIYLNLRELSTENALA